ncbi:hypothetical protein Lal_00022808 [Lupinus albus]|nr:hypothetical protein Lal_00022808 [Lupinus albus]
MYLPIFGLAEKLPSEQGITSGHIYLLSRSAEINNHLVTALVERWRPETHTFHLPNGEGSITLEDIAYQLGLPIDSDVVTGVTSLEWDNNSNELARLHISTTPEDADDIVIHHDARAFILRMIGGLLMPDTSGSRVHLMYLPLLEDLSETFNYIWGSAVLVCLYRGLCRAALISRQIEICGCLLLLQSWAYDRIPTLAPRLHDISIQLFPLMRRWSQHLITTYIPGHATNIIRSMLDRFAN